MPVLRIFRHGSIVRATRLVFESGSMLGATPHFPAHGRPCVSGHRSAPDRDVRGVGRMLAAFLAAVVAVGIGLAATEPGASVRGLPATRLYTFEEIGSVTRGSHLTFDSIGRVALVQGGRYVVLNDATWLNLAEDDSIHMLATACDTDGSTYYGALGSWGRVVATTGGGIRPESMVPASVPGWVSATNFVQIFPTPAGIYFGGWNGIVFWDRSTERTTFFELPAVACIFAMGDEVFASSHEKGIRRLDPDAGSLLPVAGVGGTIVDNVVPLDDGRHLMSTSDGRLLVYADGRFENWSGPLAQDLDGRVSAMHRLIDGGIAIAVVGRGLFIVDEQDGIRTALTTTEYHRVVHLANNEPGVLWVAVESGIAKVLYGSPVSLVGQALGLPVWFPQVVRWRDGIVVASSGRLYAPVPVARGSASRFELMDGQPGSGAWAIASDGDWLLAGNRDGVFACRDGATFVPVLAGIDVARLVLIEPDVCLAIGPGEIAALRRDVWGWTECAPRVPGVGYPAVVHAARRAAWIELGTDRVARVSFDQGHIRVRLVETFPWSGPRWVHVSVVGDVVMLVGLPERVFFDERSEQFSDAPELRRRLEGAPYWVARVCEDEAGDLFASHGHGVFAVLSKDGGYVVDSTSYDVIDDQVPVLRSIPGHGVWASTGPALYQIEKQDEPGVRAGVSPVLLSVRDRRSGAELLRAGQSLESLGRLPYERNSLDFRFFAGSYAARRSPVYEVRIDEEPWSRLGSDSVFTLADVREGSHALSVRLMRRDGQPGPETTFRFAIAPPWYRAWYAFVAYAAAGATLIFLLIRVSVRQAEARNAALEQVVAERTRELQATMDRLRQETETSATLAERNRLAGEIHDSLEQGFTGLALQLETTAGFANCPPEVRAGLATALNMVAFGKNELRHVVRDLHSAMLATAELETALRQMVAQVSPDPQRTSVVVRGTVRKLGSTIEHHLLRIAQEAITNAVKHAHASHLALELAFTPHDVQLTITDDGRGFAPGSVQHAMPGHFGLPGLRARARTIGATLEIDSRPGAGTRVAVRVPVNAPSAALATAPVHEGVYSP